MMLSMMDAIRVASHAVNIGYCGPNSYKLLTPWRREELEGPMYQTPVGSWRRAVIERTLARAELALWLMGYDTANFYAARETTVRGMIKAGMTTLPRRAA
jgi:hypothetical protein